MTYLFCIGSQMISRMCHGRYSKLVTGTELHSFILIIVVYSSKMLVQKKS